MLLNAQTDRPFTKGKVIGFGRRLLHLDGRKGMCLRDIGGRKVLPQESALPGTSHLGVRAGLQHPVLLFMRQGAPDLRIAGLTSVLHPPVQTPDRGSKNTPSANDSSSAFVGAFPVDFTAVFQHVNCRSCLRICDFKFFCNGRSCD